MSKVSLPRFSVYSRKGRGCGHPHSPLLVMSSCQWGWWFLGLLCQASPLIVSLPVYQKTTHEDEKKEGTSAEAVRWTAALREAGRWRCNWLHSFMLSCAHSGQPVSSYLKWWCSKVCVGAVGRVQFTEGFYSACYINIWRYCSYS